MKDGVRNVLTPYLLANVCMSNTSFFVVFLARCTLSLMRSFSFSRLCSVNMGSLGNLLTLWGVAIVLSRTTLSDKVERHTLL